MTASVVIEFFCLTVDFIFFLNDFNFFSLTLMLTQMLCISLSCLMTHIFQDCLKAEILNIHKMLCYIGKFMASILHKYNN